MNHENAVFEDRVVQLDGNAFVKCLFRRCVMKFSGVAPVQLTHCTFDACEFAFDGPAALTVGFMSALYNVGEFGKDLIERTFNNIREGLLSKTVSLSIECPVAKAPIKVGEMDRKMFEALDFGSQNITCPLCDQMHTWTKSDVRLGPPTALPAA
ncbi:MAG: hypothetical protein ACR2NN_13955 [Bryobacteraceae bacterium]